MTPVKLTKPQEALLRELAGKPRYVVENYAPRKRLKGLRFVSEIEWSIFQVTDKGREWNKERDAK
jgi:hypothetical protein